MDNIDVTLVDNHKIEIVVEIVTSADKVDCIIGLVFVKIKPISVENHGQTADTNWIAGQIEHKKELFEDSCKHTSKFCV